MGETLAHLLSEFEAVWAIASLCHYLAHNHGQLMDTMARAKVLVQVNAIKENLERIRDELAGYYPLKSVVVVDAWEVTV